MSKLIELMTGEVIAQNGSQTKSLIADEVNMLHFQFDHGAAAAELADVTIRVYTNNKSIVDDIAASALAQIWHHNQGSIGDNTDTMFALDLGAYHLEDKEELSVYIFNANAQSQTVDVYAECDGGLAPKQIRYQKRQDGNFTMDNVDELWLTGTALDESATIINVNDRSTPIKAFWLKATNHSQAAEDKTIVKVMDNEYPTPVTINTAYTLTTYYFLVVSSAYEEATIQKAKAKAAAVVKRQIRQLPRRSIDTAIASGQLPPNIRNMGGTN